MREIKFRAWDKKERKMWNENNIAPCAGEVMLYGGSEEVKDGTRLLTFVNTDFILMQFTGLPDKEGEDIYEGDIVDSGVWIAKVEFIVNAGMFCYTIIKSKNHEVGLVLDADVVNAKLVKIIGNIYENPELLK